MTLTTVFSPLAAFERGTPVTRGGMTTGVHSARVCGTERGDLCVVWRTPAMPAPAFTYFPTLTLAWAAYRRQRDVQLTREA